MLEPSGLRFSAPLVAAEPPESLCISIEEQLTDVRRDPSRIAAGRIVTVEEPGSASTEYTSLLLAVPREHDVLVLGAIALVPGPQPMLQPKPGFIGSITRAIHAAGDVRSVYFESHDAFVTSARSPDAQTGWPSV